MADILSDADFTKFKKLIYETSGITFSEMNRSILESRLREALHNKKLENLDQFYKMLTSDSEVLKEFLDAVTTNLTRFFRNLPHFETLEQYWRRALHYRDGDEASFATWIQVSYFSFGYFAQIIDGCPPRRLQRLAHSRHSRRLFARILYPKRHKLSNQKRNYGYHQFRLSQLEKRLKADRLRHPFLPQRPDLFR